MMQMDIIRAKKYLEQVKSTLTEELVPDLGMAKKMLGDADFTSEHTTQIQVDLYREIGQLCIKADLLNQYVALAIESCNVVVEEMEFYKEA